MLQAHDQANPKVVLIRAYQRRLRCQCGGIFILYILIGGEVRPLYPVWRGGFRGPKGRTVATLYLVSSPGPLTRLLYHRICGLPHPVSSPPITEINSASGNSIIRYREHESTNSATGEGPYTTRQHDSDRQQRSNRQRCSNRPTVVRWRPSGARPGWHTIPRLCPPCRRSIRRPQWRWSNTIRSSDHHGYGHKDVDRLVRHHFAYRRHNFFW